MTSDLNSSRLWSPLKNWETSYEVHPEGHVRTTGHITRLLKPSVVKGRAFVTLSYIDPDTGKRHYSKQSLACLIMEQYNITPPTTRARIKFLDGNPLNCSESNLSYALPKTLTKTRTTSPQAPSAPHPPLPTQQEMEKLCQMLNEDPPPAPAPAPAPKFPLIILANGKPKYDPETGEDLTWWYQENGELPPTPVDGKTLNRRR